MFHRNRLEIDLAAVCKELGIRLMTFSALSYGILTRKYNAGVPQGSRADPDDYGGIQQRITPKRIAIVDELSALARDLGLIPAQLAIAWLLRRRSSPQINA